MSKPSDILLSDDPAAALETPPPVPVDVAPTTERSGSISISGGDFATPMVRKRTITRPRGLPVVTAVAAVAAVVDHAADMVTPPPVLQNGASALERKSLVAALAVAAPAVTPPPSSLRPSDGGDSPASLHGQASRLRAGRAGAEEVVADVATPPPAAAESKAAPPLAAISVDIDPGPTPLPELEAAAPEVEVVEAPVEPGQPAQAVHGFTPADAGTLAEVALAEAQSEAPSEAQSEEAAPEGPSPAAEFSAGDAALGQASVDGVEAETESVASLDAGAIPAEPMLESDSERNLSPLAHTLAHIAEAQRELPGAADDVASEDDLELVDAPLDAAPASPAARPAAPPPSGPPPLPALPAAALATPPPIPAALAKGTMPPMAAGAPSMTTSGTLDAAGASPDGQPAVAAFSPLPEALAERPRRPKRSKPWFEEIFDEDYLRTLPFMTAEQTLREVAFIEASLEAHPGSEILDVACGYGRHAIELVQRGLNVTGLDLSLPLLIRAADEAQRRSISVNFVHADMREMPFDRKFDGAYCMLTSFGYFDEDANLKVAEGVARALKPGGRFLLDIVNRDYIVADLPTRIWWEGVGCVVLEEVDFNFHTSRIVTRRSVVFEDGRQLEQEISVRAYSLHEVGRLLRQAGFRVLDISGSMATRGRFFGGSSRNLTVLSEKRLD